MRKLMLLAAILAMALVAVAPAIAQVGQESEQDTESGDVDQSFTVTGGGDNSNQCVGLSGVANTGNSQNQIDLIQYASTADDFEFDETGSTLTVSPVNTTDCTQAVNQAASASG
jgi:maltose-binding protein MalE